MASQRLITLEERPFNAETPLEVLDRPLTPANLFYARNHFDMPRLNPSTWRLRVGGLVEKPFELSLTDLQAMPARSLGVTMECAGNGRAAVRPPPEGTPWGYGATSWAEFRGTPLPGVLENAGLAQEVREIRCSGADGDEVEPGRWAAFVRALPIAVARDPDTLLAWSMNGEPLAAEHGSPLRLIVPAWYGMASVKWLSEITALGDTFDGYFQRERYVYTGNPGGDRIPVTRMRVRAVIASPADGVRLPAGRIDISGSAWSGAGPVTSVEVTADEGRTWEPAELRPAAARYLPTIWRHHWQAALAGEYVLGARATDGAGNVQPLRPLWNRYGYGNNAVQWVRVTLS